MTGKEVKNHIKQLGYEPRHDVNALAQAINLTSEDLENKRVIKIPSDQELLELLIENKPIPYLMTHSYGFHTENGRSIIERIKNYYYKRINN